MKWAKLQSLQAKFWGTGTDQMFVSEQIPPGRTQAPYRQPKFQWDKAREGDESKILSDQLNREVAFVLLRADLWGQPDPQ